MEFRAFEKNPVTGKAEWIPYPFASLEEAEAYLEMLDVTRGLLPDDRIPEDVFAGAASGESI